MINTEWFNFFKSFFQNNAASIGTVMYANGCREGWLQGEMFRTATDEKFAVNYYQLKRYSEKLDLYGEMPNRQVQQKMVAEIKIISPSFEKKNIDGTSNLIRYLQSNDVINSLGHINQRVGSLLKDLKRLRTVTDSTIEKYIILVIPNYEEGKIKEDLKHVLYNIHLSHHEEFLSFTEHHFDVRIWKVD
ncbi:hypothetical protein [Agitococcus lubricus]|uniref:Uncharacterized protein n=1 Tax=Agitococcus lubricus TaxID=1077255 RepID=A0A2T5ISG9_9GAMM|nr:hypothetical protein [Agitococcus lubricus]PTQ86798.1 hypothetical protein C8N29_1274 [Agitococcus lubricus]